MNDQTFIKLQLRQLPENCFHSKKSTWHTSAEKYSLYLSLTLIFFRRLKSKENLLKIVRSWRNFLKGWKSMKIAEKRVGRQTLIKQMCSGSKKKKIVPA